MLGPEDLGTWPTRSSPGPATHHGAVKREGNSLRRAPAWVFRLTCAALGGRGAGGQGVCGCSFPPVSCSPAPPGAPSLFLNSGAEMRWTS